jgi:hypothetical protein
LQVMGHHEHAALSGRYYRQSVAEKIRRLAEYEKRFGPLK